jgi:hypothetical protein
MPLHPLANITRLTHINDPPSAVNALVQDDVNPALPPQIVCLRVGPVEHVATDLDGHHSTSRA